MNGRSTGMASKAGASGLAFVADVYEQSTSVGFCKRAAHGVTRRRFVQGLIAGGIIVGFDSWRWPAFALGRRNGQAVLTGTHFEDI